jgi:hypothetical protein
MVEHDDDHAFRLESPEQHAPLHRLGPRVRFEKDVPFGKRVEVEIGARLATDIAQAVGGMDQGRIGKREIAVCADVKAIEPHLDSGIGGKLKAERSDLPLNAGLQALLSVLPTSI